MFNIDRDGMIVGEGRISAARVLHLERGQMKQISGIVVHQTDSASASATLNGYRTNPKANAAHFLIDKDGAIYQTASVSSRTWHVGPVRARCLVEHKCTPAEFVRYKKIDPRTMDKLEMLKTVPSRYPSNNDSIGIEIVGKCKLPPGKKVPTGLTVQKQNKFMEDNAVYEPVNGAQLAALQYLIDGLTSTLQIPKTEIHRHPEVSRKHPTEALTANWK